MVYEILKFVLLCCVRDVLSYLYNIEGTPMFSREDKNNVQLILCHRRLRYLVITTSISLKLCVSFDSGN